MSSYWRNLGSRCCTRNFQGSGIRWRSMAIGSKGFAEKPGLIADLDSHLFATLRSPIQKGPTLSDLSHEFSANANRVLNTHLPCESTPPSSRRLRFDKPDSDEDHHGIVMVAHCMSPGDDLNPQKAKVKLSSGFVIGSGLIVTCAHAFEEVSSSMI
jgi:hypothetical protein